jgi:hypothetical protein
MSSNIFESKQVVPDVRESVMGLTEIKRIKAKTIKIDVANWDSIRPGDIIYWTRADNNKMSMRTMVLRTFRTKEMGKLMFSLAPCYNTEPKREHTYTVNSSTIGELYRETDVAIRQILSKLEPEKDPENPFL